MNKKMQAILDTKVERGSAALWWLGQMGLVVKSGSTLIVIDYFAAPFPTRQVAPPVPAEEMVGVDAFLGTHNHIDHIDHPSWRIWAKTNPEAKFVFPRAHSRAVANDGIADRNALGVNAGESVRIGTGKRDCSPIFSISSNATAYGYTMPATRSGMRG